MRRRKAIAFGLVILAGVGGYYAGWFRFNYPAKREYPVHGVDISHHQKDIRWFKASLNGVQFAYLKATEGTDFRDREFQYNWQQCQRSGITPGAYHFFNFCRSGEEQARQFLETVPPGGPALPPALDLEFSPNCRKVLSRPEMVRLVKAFVNGIATRYPGRPVFYATPDFYKRYLEGHRSDFPDHYLWIRNVVKEPSLAPCAEWTFWQYADHARVPGIAGPVDLNVYCGNPEQFQALIQP